MPAPRRIRSARTARASRGLRRWAVRAARARSPGTASRRSRRRSDRPAPGNRERPARRSDRDRGRRRSLPPRSPAREDQSRGIEIGRAAVWTPVPFTRVAWCGRQSPAGIRAAIHRTARTAAMKRTQDASSSDTSITVRFISRPAFAGIPEPRRALVNSCGACAGRDTEPAAPPMWRKSFPPLTFPAARAD